MLATHLHKKNKIIDIEQIPQEEDCNIVIENLQPDGGIIETVKAIADINSNVHLRFNSQDEDAEKFLGFTEMDDGHILVHTASTQTSIAFTRDYNH